MTTKLDRIKARPDLLAKDFRKFVYVLLSHLNLSPTELQYDACLYLQFGPKRRQLQAFRGFSKSWLLAFYTCWLLYKDPNHKIMVVSATGGRALDFSTFVLQLLRDVPCLQHLYPRDDQRQSVLKFDVNGAMPAQSPSVRSSGIDGQITGARANTIIADDIEIPNNSDTEGKRLKLSERAKEFAAILNPEGEIVVLGTPQTEDSIYPKMEAERGYKVRIWPAMYPTADELRFYGNRLSPAIARKLEHMPELEGKPTEPSRFTEVDMEQRKAEYGRSGFSLQFQLDTRLSDKLRYPLRLSDLIVMECNEDNGPEKPIWASSPELTWDGLFNPGFNGDRYYRPMRLVGDFIPYTQSAMHIDPSGRGTDELAYCITKQLNGYVYVLAAGGLMGGYVEDNLKLLVKLAKQYKVNAVEIEANFGDGMFTQLIGPWFAREYPVSVLEIRHSSQKERRIIDTLEPVMNQHRLVFSAETIRKDRESAETREAYDKRVYTLTYQLSHITKERGCLIHDDRIDALAMAVSYWQSLLQKDAERSMKVRKEALLDAELKKFMDSANKPWRSKSDRKWATVR